MDTQAVDAALSHLDSNWQKYLDQLAALVRIPGVSADPAPNGDLKRCAEAVRDLLAGAGFERCEVIEWPGGHPYAYGEWLHAEGAPTVLLYGHHDVQPPGRPEKWLSPAYEPEERDGRLYGRGAVDDKAGVMMHVAACAAFLETTGKLPVNMKFIIEGEEEVGSPSLEAFLEQNKAKLAGDVIVLTDTANLEAGLPSITTALRGLAGVEVEVRGLDHPVHSGMWSGPIPDPVMGLVRALAELSDDRNRPAFEGAWEGVRPLSDAEREEMEALPFDEAAVRRDVGVLPGTELVGDPEMPEWGRIFRQPTVTIVALEARPIEGSSNQLIESARARVSVRVVPDQDPQAITDALVKHFERRVPWGLEVEVKPEGTAGWWICEATGPAFDAARRSLEKGYGVKPAIIGCGGSIPFVEPFARVLGGVPALLMGVEDPPCNAHGENESLNIADWKAGTRSAVYLYADLAESLR